MERRWRLVEIGRDTVEMWAKVKNQIQMANEMQMPRFKEIRDTIETVRDWRLWTATKFKCANPDDKRA